MRALFILGGLGIVAGSVMLAFGTIFLVAPPSFPFYSALFALMGPVVLVGGGLCAVAAIGILQRKPWARTVAYTVLWPMAVLAAINAATSLISLDIGAFAVLTIIFVFALKNLSSLNSPAVKAFLNVGVKQSRGGAPHP